MNKYNKEGFDKNVKESHISLNIDNLPSWKPYRNVPTGSLKSALIKNTEETVLKSSSSNAYNGDHWRSTKSEVQLQSKTTFSHHSKIPKAPINPTLPEDLNLSWDIAMQNASNGANYENEIHIDVESLGQSDNKLLLNATGKRPAGVGTENEQQSILMAERSQNGVVLRITLLAAGFIVGPNGASIHQIEAVTGASIYSFNRSKDKEIYRPTRQFHIEGSPDILQHAVDILCHAVQLYKDLAEGNHCGMTVKRLHKLDNVLFRYEPPPRAKVPFAAQVEYDAAELKVLQETRGHRSAYAIKEVREQLARRDEALMRSNLPVRPTKERMPLLPGRRNLSYTHSLISLDEPDIQNHDLFNRQLIDAFEGLMPVKQKPSKAMSNSFGSNEKTLEKGLMHSNQSDFENIPRNTRDGNMKAFYPQYKAGKNEGIKGTEFAANDTKRGLWKQGGLYGIDSLF